MSVASKEDPFGPIMLLLSMGSGWLVNETTGRYGLAWIVGLLVLFSPLLLIGGAIAVESAADVVKEVWAHRSRSGRHRR